MAEYYFIYDQVNQLYMAQKGGWTDSPHEALMIPSYDLNSFTILSKNQYTVLETGFWWNHSISHATHRPQDLIPRFVEAMLNCHANEHSEIMEHWPDLFDQQNRFIPNIWCDDESEWWIGEHAQGLLNYLFNQLNTLCPPGIHFGAHGGDGSDFGFWVDDPDPSKSD